MLLLLLQSSNQDTNLYFFTLEEHELTHYLQRDHCLNEIYFPKLSGQVPLTLALASQTEYHYDCRTCTRGRTLTRARHRRIMCMLLS